MAIRRNISVLNPGIIADIDIVYGSDLIPIEFYVTDYTLPDNAIATLYCTTSDKQLLKSVGTITNNVLLFDPTAGFFTVGKNILQIRITANEKNLYTFEVGVNCKPRMATDDAQEAESQPTLIDQLLTQVGNVNGELQKQQKEVETLNIELNKANNKIKDFAKEIYPIGSIYMSVSKTNPTNLFGGTWEQIKDTFLLACGDTYENGATGGESEHTLTIDEMPSHDHKTSTKGFTYGINWADAGGNAWSANSSPTYPHEPNTGKAGGGQAHNNMPPYLAVYTWVRTE